jgi:hypothetical protein
MEGRLRDDLDVQGLALAARLQVGVGHGRHL